ncbi:MAG: Gfo/Idh/MocA family oxidoreductase [Mogibacterium sp.]|nr:Gfo/Idh/MocA family oxidoreductase [Mogibacterium sp.]
MKYALIGCGMISPNHINAALANDLEIVALCDLVEENRNKALELIPKEKRENINLYENYFDMLDIEHPDIVAIALGSGLKRRLSIDCMKAGANVIVEKPIALSLEDADAMISTAKEYGVKLIVNHQLRFGETVRALKAESQSGNFGKLLHGTVQVRRNRNKAYFDAGKWRGTWDNDGGTLMNQCIHYTDILQWIMCSEVEEVFAYTDRMIHPYIEAEDLGLALLKFKNGAYGIIEGTVNTYPRNLSDSIAIFGEEGTVSLRGKTLSDVEAWEFKTGPKSRDDAIRAFGIEHMGSGHAPLYKYAIRAVNGNDDALCPAEESRSALELVLAIYQSASEGRPVRLPLSRGATTDFVGRFDKKL